MMWWLETPMQTPSRRRPCPCLTSPRLRRRMALQPWRKAPTLAAKSPFSTASIPAPSPPRTLSGEAKAVMGETIWIQATTTPLTLILIDTSAAGRATPAPPLSPPPSAPLCSPAPPPCSRSSPTRRRPKSWKPSGRSPATAPSPPTSAARPSPAPTSSDGCTSPPCTVVLGGQTTGSTGSTLSPCTKAGRWGSAPTTTPAPRACSSESWRRRVFTTSTSTSRASTAACRSTWTRARCRSKGATSSRTAATRSSTKTSSLTRSARFRWRTSRSSSRWWIKAPASRGTHCWESERCFWPSCSQGFKEKDLIET